jgi:hypothetical protein
MCISLYAFIAFILPLKKRMSVQTKKKLIHAKTAETMGNQAPYEMMKDHLPERGHQKTTSG